MNIAIDVSPLTSGHFLQHRVRGTGFYLTNLRDSFLKNPGQNNFTFFSRGEEIPNETEIVHYPYFEPFFLTLPFKKSKKTVVTVHDLTPLVFKNRFPAGMKGKIRWEVQKKSLQRMDAIITDSYSSKKDIHKFAKIPAESINVVYLAAAKHFRPQKQSETLKTAKKYNIPEKFILYVGDATWNKNLPNLMKSVTQTDHNLVIVGNAFTNQDFDKSNPWNQSLYEAQVLAQDNKKIIPLGFVPDEDLISLYNLAKAFIMPSFYEGFGLPVLEAMQSGCPVITTRCGSLEEVADSAAYFVDPHSTESIKKGIEEVMSDEKLRKALSKKGIEQAKNFTWEKTAEQTLNVYKKVLSDE